MKNKKLIKILATIVSCLLLVGAVIGITVSAAETAPEIEYKNVAYEGTVQIVYYVNTNDVAEGYTVKLATWTKADMSDLVTKEAESFTKEVGEVFYTIFTSEGIAPKNMRDTVYAQTVLYNGEDVVDRGEVVEYSVYTYVSNRLAKDYTGAQKALYHALVDYAASVQKVLGYKTYELANEMFADFDYNTQVRDASQTGYGDNKNTMEAYTTTRTLYKSTSGAWSSTTSEGATTYVFTYLYNGTSNVGIDGKSFVISKRSTIISITENDVDIDSVKIGNVVYSIGDVMPNNLSGAVEGYIVEPHPTYFVPTTVEVEDLTALRAVFDTNVKITANGEFNLCYRTKKQSGAYFNPSIVLKGEGGKVYLGGVDIGVAVGEVFNLRITSEYVTADEYTIKFYVNGSKEATVTKTITNSESNWNTTSGLSDVLFYASRAYARDTSLVFTDTSSVVYVAKTTDIEEMAGVNKVDLSAGNKAEYVKTGSIQKTVGTETYTLGYKSTAVSYYNEADGSLTFGIQVLISSITDSSSNALNYIVVDGVVYSVGDPLNKAWHEAYAQSAWTQDHDVYSLIAPEFAGEIVDGCLLQLSTEFAFLNDYPETSGNTNHLRLSANGKVNVLNIANSNGYINIGGVVTNARVGRMHNLVIRAYAADSGYKLNVYINGDYVTSFNQAVLPADFGFSIYSASRDTRVVLRNTYCDSYENAFQAIGGVNKLDYSAITNGTKPEIVSTSYLKEDTNTGNFAVVDSSDYTHSVEWVSYAPYGVNEGGDSWTYRKSLTIKSIKTLAGAETSIVVGGVTYGAGSVVPRRWIDSSDAFQGSYIASPEITGSYVGSRSDMLRMVLDTTAVIESSYAGGTLSMKIREWGRGQGTSVDGVNITVDASGNVLMDGKSIGVKSGESFNLRVEVYESATADYVDFKVIVNGETVIEKTTQLKDGSNRIYITSSGVQFSTNYDARDIHLTFSDTYCDRYYAAKNAVDFSAEKTDSHSTSSKSVTGTDGNSYTVKYDVNVVSKWDEATGTYTYGQHAIVTEILDANSNPVDSVTLSSGTYAVGSVWPKVQHSWIGEPTKTFTAKEAGNILPSNDVVFQFATDLTINNPNGFIWDGTNAHAISINIQDVDAFMDISFADNGNIKIRGVDTGVKCGEEFNLVLRAAKVRNNNGEETGTYTVYAIVNGKSVTSRTISKLPTNLTLKAYSSTRDMDLVFRNTFFDKYVEAE